MGDDDRCIGNERGDGIAIDFMAGCDFVGNAVKLDGFFGDRSGGLVERIKGIEDSRDGAVWLTRNSAAQAMPQTPLGWRCRRQAQAASGLIVTA
jgi:hypothetical protein